jgi:hypothetical protein
VNTLPALLPVARIWDIPFDAEEADPLWCYNPSIGGCIRDWIPPGCGRAMVVVNGVALMQAEWVRPVLPGDVIDWHLLPTGGGDNKGTSRQVLTIIAIIVISYYTGGLVSGGTLSAGQAGVLSIALNLAAQVLINAIIPIKALDVSANSASSVYNVALSANSARLNQPIPVIYGRMKTFPDFAAQPYAYYVNNNQYYAALFCIGQGHYTIERVMIDDTNIRNFEDVKYRILPPGSLPTLVKTNVVTAPEIAGQELKPGRFTAGYTVCAAGYTVNRIEVDVTMDQGIGYMENDGSITPFPLDMRVDIRYVDDFGVPTSAVTGSAAWFNVMTPNITGATRTAQRRTFGVDITPGRVEVRMTRTTIGYTDNHYVTTANWAAMRGFIVDDDGIVLHAGATHMEVLMKASEQLTGLNQRKVNVIARRKLNVQLAEGVFAGLAETRSIAWAIQDIWLNQVYGAQQEFNTHDYDTLVILNNIWAARQDYLDIIFDSRTTVREALKIVTQAGRAVAYQRMGMLTVARDQMQTLPIAGFSGRNIVAGSATIAYALPTPETADAVTVEYFDNRIWDWVPVVCPAPGVTTPVNPVILRLAGITQYYQAKREGTYKAADNLWRREFPRWDTEMLGRLPTYGSPVLFAPAMPGWAQSGDVVDASGFSVRLSEPVTFEPGVTNYISFMGPYGSYGAAIIVTPGGDPHTVTLASAPSTELVFSDSDRARTRYIFGPQGHAEMMVRVLSLKYKGHSDTGPIVEVSGVSEDNRVHTADNEFLPVGGVVQSPVPTSEAGDLDNPPVGDVPDPEAGGEYYYTVKIGNPRYTANMEIGGDITAQHVFYNTGAQTVSIFDPRPYWMLYGAVEPAIAAQYEVRAVVDETVPSGDFVPPTAFNGTWHNLGATVTFAFPLHIPETGILSGTILTYKALVGRFEIRDVATHTLQDSGNFILECFIPDAP